MIKPLRRLRLLTRAAPKVLGGLACAALLRADFDAESWRVRRQIQLAQPAAVAQFTVDGALYRASSASLDDLRIMRGGGEVPYVLSGLTGSRETLDRPAVMVNKAWTPNVGLQAIFDLKDQHGHDRIRIGTNLHNFKENVRVETSDDQRVWAVATTSGLIFDVLRDEYAVAELTVDYPVSTRRFVRITIPGWHNAGDLTGAWLADFNETDAVRDAVTVTTPAVIRENPKLQTTELVLDLGFPGRPYDLIDVTVGPGLFSRSAEVWASQDGEHWFTRGGGAILRTTDAEKLGLETAEIADRYLKITIFNGDSAPLHFGPIALRGTRRVVSFPAAEPGPYVLYSGNAGAHAPAYDLARVMPRNVQPEGASLGPEEPNPMFRAPERPWSDRNPWVLNSVLIAAVGAMGLITVRMLQKVKPS